MTLAEVRAAIPAYCMRPDTRRALGCSALALGLHAAAVSFGWLVWVRGWSALYPVSWLISGTTATSLFVLGHDCGHRSFLSSQRAMTVLGHLFFLPTLYPFYAWQYSHQAHHRHTNRMARTRDVDHDNTWLPISREMYERLRARRPWKAWLYRTARVILPLGSTMHLLLFHFDSRDFKPNQRRQVRASLALLVISVVLALAAALAAFGSVWIVFHLWLIPAVCFQLWMSLYTFLHHTAADKRVLAPGDWNPYAGQVENTINCLFPRPISWIHFNIDVHLPHHVSTKVPCYHLRVANAALKHSACAGDLTELPFSIRYLVKQVRQCQVWDEQAQRYARIDS